MSENTETAIRAGGCFWPAQEPLRHRDGVISTRVGYTGGENDHPTAGHHPGHAEAIEVIFDPGRTSYRNILEFFFQIYRPDLGEGVVGSGYRSEIFYTSDEQRQVAEDTIAGASGFWGGKVVTKISQARPRPTTRTTSSDTPTATISSARIDPLRDSRRSSTCGESAARRGRARPARPVLLRHRPSREAAMATETLRLLLPRMSEERESAMIQAVGAVAGMDRPSRPHPARHRHQPGRLLLRAAALGRPALPGVPVRLVKGPRRGVSRRTAVTWPGSPSLVGE